MNIDEQEVMLNLPVRFKAEIRDREKAALLNFARQKETNIVVTARSNLGKIAGLMLG